MNILGEAMSLHEQQLEAAVSSISQWRGKRITYRPVSGGISNTNWRVEVEGADTAYFFKIPGAGTEMFIDRCIVYDASFAVEVTGY